MPIDELGPLPDLNELGDLVTPEEYQQMQDEQAMKEALGITPGDSLTMQLRKAVPWFDMLYGRLDPSGLREQYGKDVVKDIVRNFGVRIFKAKAKGGLPLDVLHQEIESTLGGGGNAAYSSLDNIISQDDIIDFLTAPKEGRRLFQLGDVSKPFYVYRGSRRADSPDNGPGYTMWADNADSVEHYAGHQGDRFWRAEVSGAPGIDELMPDILRELETDVREVREGGLASDNNEMTEAIRRALDEMEGASNAEIAEALAQSFNPADIVDSADAYDNYGFVNWLWERVLEEKNIRTIRTKNGAISFDPEIAEKYREYFSDFSANGGEQVAAMNIDPAYAALQRDTDAWKQTVDNFLAGELKEDRPITMLRQTPLVLQMLGAENRRLNATLHLLRDGLGEIRNLPESVMKDIPEALTDPIMVFKSASTGGDLVVMLELKDRHGGTVIVPIALEQTGEQGYTVNLAMSVYGKTNQQTLKPNNQWFANQISAGNLLYQNKKKSRDWARHSKLQLPATGTGLSTSANPKVHTEADLVKLRQQNPTFYQNRLNAGKANIAYTKFGPDKYSIVLGKNANLSSLVHELGHVFEMELRSLVASGYADESQMNDIRILDEWLSRMDDDAEFKKEYDRWLRKQVYGGRKLEKLSAFEREEARDRAKREYFARGFEAYVREGKAPSEEMKSVFARFLEWLLAVYKHAKSLGVEMNDEVRGVFDRMLATEEDINEAAVVNALDNLTDREMDALNMRGKDREHAAGLMELAKQRAFREVMERRNKDRGARAKALARVKISSAFIMSSCYPVTG